MDPVEFIKQAYDLIVTKITSDWSILVPILCEILVFGIKSLSGDVKETVMRLLDQLIDAPTDFMVINLGYVGGLIVLPDIDIKKYWAYSLLMVVGMMIVWYLNRLNRFTLKKFNNTKKDDKEPQGEEESLGEEEPKGENKPEKWKIRIPEKLVIGFKLFLFFWAMYLIPIAALIGALSLIRT